MESVTASEEVNNNKTVLQLKEAHDCDNEEDSLLANPTSIEVTDPEEWLCVAKLPPNTTETSFCDLLSQFGNVKESFLMVSSKTGEFKGYGFACFTSKVAALQARHVLEGQEVDGHVVDVGWLKEGVHQVTDLHSKVLYVDKLPVGFRDLAQFRTIFSSIVNPPYCQIAQKNGVLHDWGLVEFNTGEQAEATMETLRNAQLDNQPIRVQYCIPNNHAINIYMSFVNNPMEIRTEKKALMDETPSKDVYNQLQSLSKHNPWFVQSLQSIMTQNILAEDHPQLQPQADIKDSSGSKTVSNQAVLALLLAAYLKPNQGVAQAAGQLSSLIKQLEAGTSAVELLKTALSGAGETHQAPADLNTLISSMTSSIVGNGKTQQPVTPNTKNPQLMNMLYSAFQARMSKMKSQQSDTEPLSPSASPSQVSPTPCDKETTPVPAPATGDGLLAAPPCYPMMYPAPAGQWQWSPTGHDPAAAPVSSGNGYPAAPVSSQAKTLNQFLSMPPPPPPGAPSLPPDQWHLLPAPAAPGQLLYTPLLPPQQPHCVKRKLDTGLYPETQPDNQMIKRQKLC